MSGLDHILIIVNFLVNVENCFSDPADLKCGSILGPLLFLLYINDLPQAIHDCDALLYADDTCISFNPTYTRGGGAESAPLDIFFCKRREQNLLAMNFVENLPNDYANILRQKIIILDQDFWNNSLL